MTKAMTWTLEKDWPDEEREAVLSCLGDMFSKANNAMLDKAAAVDGLTGGRRRRVRHAITAGHLLCALCAGALQVLDRLKDAAKVTGAQIAEAVVDSVLTELFPKTSTPAVRAAVKAVAAAGAEHLVSMLLTPDAVRALRFGGAISCPDWSRHPSDAVWEHCVKPLFAKLLDDKEQQWSQQQLKVLTL
ncbi:hypothetical protein NY551_00435 [Curtobacterium flaccumfaciens pv. oortii]|uniref:hypothetical protein n=1 Tax=Curtobacterium flaccumfaciens TaxID=2035 RepID=UPI002659E48B|nr:hypothetical protein [Curtobacterium flaccumfaciens]MCS5521198.1 hypothetical protein [Curtobacterium flaccumfaciens pv. oortii]